KKNTLPPKEFIAYIERRKLIITITNQIIEKVIHDLKKLPNNIKLSINIPPIYLENGHLFKILTNHKWKYCSNIHFEITERFPFSNLDKVKSEMSKINTLGYQVAIDDFGMGYGGIYYLNELNINKIKIDKSFVDIVSRNRSKKLLNAIVAFAKMADLEIIAEGVEHKEQANYLHDIGIYCMQGFLFSKPLNITDFISWIRENKNKYTI
ncbi:EAL domain-containing protein, partial [Plesiomonas shigelloides]|uniref:EAL domain-containing protein n=1 Tax=Plesiomonas shigelloides TaxID=703 RepID=UPI00126184EB